MPLHNVTGGTPAAYNQQLGSAPLPYNQQLGSANASPFINSPVGLGVPSYGTNPAGLGAAHAGGLHNVTGGTPAAFNQQLSQVAYTQQLAPGATGLNNAGLGGNHTGMNMHPGGLHRITGGTAAAYNSQLGSTGGAASAHPVGTHRITGGTPAAYNSQLMGLMNNSSLSGNPSGSTSTFAGSPMGSSFINSPISQVGGNQNLFSSPTPASTGVQNTFVGSQASTSTRETEQWSLGGQQQLGGQHWGQQQLGQQQFGQQQLGQQWGQQQQQQLSGQQWGQQQFGQQQLGSQQLEQQWTQEQLSHNLPSGAVTRAPIVQETVRTRVIEEIVPIIHREVPQPFIERVEQHSTEHIVQPTTMTKEVVGQRPLVSNIAGAPVL